MKKICAYIGIVLSLVLPIASIIFFTGMYDFNLYNFLWCGFYGSIIVCLLNKNKIYKVIAVVMNAFLIIFIGFGALMGGITGLGIYIGFVLIPFYSFILFLL